MKTVTIVYNIIQQTLRKNKQGTLRVSEIETAINIGIFNFFEKQLRLFRISGFVPTPLEPLIKVINMALTSGNSVLPTGFSKEVAFNTQELDSAPGDFLSYAEFIDRQSSSLLRADNKNPIATIHDKTVYVYPSDIQQISFTYISLPTAVAVATTVSGRILVYNETNSTDTNIRPEYAPMIAKEALLFLGIQEQNQGAAELGATSNQ